MQSRAVAMQALMDQIRSSKDPAERKKPLEQHHQLMLKSENHSDTSSPGGAPTESHRD